LLSLPTINYCFPSTIRILEIHSFSRTKRKFICYNIFLLSGFGTTVFFSWVNMNFLSLFFVRCFFFLYVGITSLLFVLLQVYFFKIEFISNLLISIWHLAREVYLLCPKYIKNDFVNFIHICKSFLRITSLAFPQLFLEFIKYFVCLKSCFEECR
jgi:hypothetical protein